MEKLTAKEVIENKIEFETSILELHKKDLENNRKALKDFNPIYIHENLELEKQNIRTCIMVKEEVIMVLKELLEEID